MAADLDLTRVSALLPAEVIKELTPLENKQNSSNVQPIAEEADSEKGLDRAALETSSAVDNVTNKGKLVIHQDEESGWFVRLLEDETGEVIQQWPSEDFLEFVRYAGETSGVLVDEVV